MSSENGNGRHPTNGRLLPGHRFATPGNANLAKTKTIGQLEKEHIEALLIPAAAVLREAITGHRPDTDAAPATGKKGKRTKLAPWAVRLDAAKYVFDRLFGKPKQHQEHSGSLSWSITYGPGMPLEEMGISSNGTVARITDGSENGAHGSENGSTGP